jgi:hypothetical protein
MNNVKCSNLRSLTKNIYESFHSIFGLQCLLDAHIKRRGHIQWMASLVNPQKPCLVSRLIHAPSSSPGPNEALRSWPWLTSLRRRNNTRLRS